jgi:REP element-mobilizing transposase RayT
MYGFWLPNDPRGSWSDFVRKWELARFGEAVKTLARKELDELTEEELHRRAKAKQSLTYPAVSISGQQALSIAKGFAKQCAKSNYSIWACSIMPEHTHLVLARHTYKVEQMANLLKGAATTETMSDENHPLQSYAEDGERPPRMWSAHEWKQYLDSEEAIEQAIRYVEENPEKEGLRRQTWSFVTPFGGINTAGWTTYH